MSPETSRLDAAVEAVRRRGWVVASASAAAAGGAVAAVSIPAGIVVAVAVAAWRSRAAGRSRVIRSIEIADPRWRNLLITADEIAAGTLASPTVVRERVFAQATARASSIDPRAVFPWRPLRVWGATAIAAWSIAAFVGAWQQRPSPRATAASTPSRTAPAAPSPQLRVALTLEPPRYTGLVAATAIDPSEVQAVEGTTARLVVDSPASRVTIDHDGAPVALVRAPSGRFEHRVPLTRSGYLVITADDGLRRMILVTVSPDVLPSVRLSAPGRDLVFGGGNPTIRFEASATDDFGLRSLRLQYTAVSGSGEQFDFKDGEIPLSLVKRSPREWHGTVSRSLADLDLKDGDTLVYRAVAADERPGDATASSDSFFIEVSRRGVAAGDAFTLPEQETRYALSQQMLIVKTERLDRQRSSMPQADFAEAALNLGVEQRMIRAEFVFMLGGEVQDEEVEAEQSSDIQEGRLANRGQRDVRQATVAMSQAEKLLAGANTADAVKAERAAVAALQRAFSKDRYILRALATRGELDPQRRLSGVASGAMGWRRPITDAPANRRAALLDDLLNGIGAASREADRASLALLAEFAVRIDPGSAVLRQAAADLEALADSWSSAGAGDRTARLDAVAGRIADEARRALADPPVVVGAVR